MCLEEAWAADGQQDFAEKLRHIGAGNGGRPRMDADVDVVAVEFDLLVRGW